MRSLNIYFTVLNQVEVGSEPVVAPERNEVLVRAEASLISGCYPYPWWIIQIPLCNAIYRNSVQAMVGGVWSHVFLATTPFRLIMPSFTQVRFMAS